MECHSFGLLVGFLIDIGKGLLELMVIMLPSLSTFASVETLFSKE